MLIGSVLVATGLLRCCRGVGGDVLRIYWSFTVALQGFAKGSPMVCDGFTKGLPKMLRGFAEDLMRNY